MSRSPPPRPAPPPPPHPQQLTPSHTPSSPTPASSTATLVPPPTTLPALDPTELLCLLRCPICQTSQLEAPTTLQCGHTVCSAHILEPPTPSPAPRSDGHPLAAATASRPPRLLDAILGGDIPAADRGSAPAPPPLRLPTCPIPSCVAHASSYARPVPVPNIPPSSTVKYFPSPSPHPSLRPSEPIKVSEARVDVTVNKVLAIAQRARARLHALTIDRKGKGRASDGDTWSSEDELAADDEVDISHRVFVEVAENDDDVTDKEQEDTPERQTFESETVAGPRRIIRGRLPAVQISSTSTLVDPPPTPPTPRRAYSPPSPPTRRPRKRQRRSSPLSSGHAPVAPSTRAEALTLFEKELSSELACDLCFTLLYEPTTTICQHTFCSRCMRRSLDHSLKCPVCRADVPEYAFAQEPAFNKVLLTILLKAFPDAYSERGVILDEEERAARLNTPIFVCQLSFPGQPTLLHIFEPRYRLMLRRCLESPAPHFGMIMPPRADALGAGSDYGTILEIRSVQMLPDGRSMVETWGTHRFRILERGSLDGYMVGRIERVEDYPASLEEDANRSVALVGAAAAGSTNSNGSVLTSRNATAASPPPASAHSSQTPHVAVGESSATPPVPPPTNTELMAICHSFVTRLRNGTAPWVVQRLDNTYGPMPTNPSDFSFWMALVLPIEDHEKAKLLPIKSPHLRLRLVVHWIEQLNANWWFNSGCTVC